MPDLNNETAWAFLEALPIGALWILVALVARGLYVFPRMWVMKEIAKDPSLARHWHNKVLYIALTLTASLIIGLIAGRGFEVLADSRRGFAAFWFVLISSLAGIYRGYTMNKGTGAERI